jgi:hypothetical protein
MDTLCATDCGPVYTNAILAARLNCADGTSPNPTPAAPQKGAGVDKAAADGETPDKPTYPQDYPGLRMGCVKDKKDNSFCAVKRAAISAPTGKAAVCDFYFSWCVFGGRAGLSLCELLVMVVVVMIMRQRSECVSIDNVTHAHLLSRFPHTHTLTTPDTSNPHSINGSTDSVNTTTTTITTTTNSCYAEYAAMYGEIPQNFVDEVRRDAHPTHPPTHLFSLSAYLSCPVCV